MKNKLNIFPFPNGAVENKNMTVKVRQNSGEWKEITPYKVKVDMHEIREASMAYFDFIGEVECEITHNLIEVTEAIIRPLSKKISYEKNGNSIRFTLSEPVNLSVEFNGDRFHNLHLFAGKVESMIPNPHGESTIYLGDCRDKRTIHRTGDIVRKLKGMERGRILYFGPGVHYLEEGLCALPSNTKVYIEGGAVVMGGFIIEEEENVTIEGRGVLYLAHFDRLNAMRGIRLSHAKHILIDGITMINPAHYSVYIGASHDVVVNNIKSFSCEGWSDGIDMMSSTNVLVQNVFMRNSDDCIAIYGRRWDYNGATNNIIIKDSTLWADVAHPTTIGLHGDYEHDGNIIENITFENIDILEHHELQDGYLGCLAINAGDKNIVRNILYEDIRIEQIERGKLFDIQVVFNPDYNPAPGRRVENIRYKNISYQGVGEKASYINGQNDESLVENVTFENLVINGTHILSAEEGNIIVGKHARNIQFL